MIAKRAEAGYPLLSLYRGTCRTGMACERGMLNSMSRCAEAWLAALALQAPELPGCDGHDFSAAMHGDVP